MKKTREYEKADTGKESIKFEYVDQFKRLFGNKPNFALLAIALSSRSAANVETAIGCTMAVSSI